MARPTKDKPAVHPAVYARGRILMPLGGVDYVLRPSWEAIDTIETTLGRSLLELAGDATGGRLRIAEMAVIVTEMMKAEGKADPQAGPSYSGAKAAKVAELLYEQPTAQVTARLSVLLVGAVTGGYTAAGEPKPAA
jgi:hypothetical protein